MEYVRNFVRDNLMLLLFGAILLCIAFLGSLANPKMDYHSVPTIEKDKDVVRNLY